MAWLDGDSVVEVGDVDTLNQDVSAMGVNTISVQWEHRQSHTVTVLDSLIAEEKLTDLELTFNVNMNFHVVHVQVVNILQFEMEAG